MMEKFNILTVNVTMLMTISLSYLVSFIYHISPIFYYFSLDRWNFFCADLKIIHFISTY